MDGSHFAEMRTVGKGGFGKVFPTLDPLQLFQCLVQVHLVEHKITKQLYAMKKVKVSVIRSVEKCTQ